MPLSELYRLAKGKLDSTQDKNATCSNGLSSSSRPENDEFVELVWENGQVMMQGQSSRTRKAPNSTSLPNHIPKPRDCVGNGSNTKYGKFGVMDCALNEFHVPGPSGEMGLNQDDDLVPWLGYPADKSLQNGYCSDFMTELSGVTVNEASTRNQLPSIGKRYSDNPSMRSNPVSVQNGVSSEQGNVSKVSWLYPSSHGSKVSDCNNMSDSIRLAVSQDSPTAPTMAGGFSGMMPQKPDPPPPGRNSVLMNFSHFSRPAALTKTNLQSIGARPGSGSRDKVSTSYSNIGESKLFHSNNGGPKEISPSRQSTAVPQKANSRPSHDIDIPVEEPAGVKQSTFTHQETALKADKNANQIAESSIKGLPDVEKAIEPAVACSSVCSGNSIERPSDDATHNSKRKSRDTDSECPSEDVEEESMDVKRAAHARAGTSSKRSRAAEVHNLSERRRRDRINEKMRSLQELIPNCNKVDKASMLDEAIEYLKTLQLQVQIMSMGAGLYMPQMMMPPHLHPAHMGHFSPMVGMGMGMGMGMHYGMGMPDMHGVSSGFPMHHPMQGAHFPCPPIPPTSAAAPMHAIAGSNLQVHGLPSQGLPMSTPRPPLIPLSGGPPVKSAVEQNLDSSLVCGSKDLMQNTSTKSSINQTPTQCQATNNDLDRSALAQNNGKAANAKAGEAANNAD